MSPEGICRERKEKRGGRDFMERRLREGERRRDKAREGRRGDGRGWEMEERQERPCGEEMSLR